MLTKPNFAFTSVSLNDLNAVIGGCHKQQCCPCPQPQPAPAAPAPAPQAGPDIQTSVQITGY